VNAVCAEIAELIPWVVNRTASAAERACVFAHVTACADCRRELVQALALRMRLQRSIEALGACEALWSPPLADPVSAAKEAAPSRLRQLVALGEAMRLPAFATDALRLAIGLRESRPALSLNVPLVARITARA
jgi:hypothetical protein